MSAAAGRRKAWRKPGLPVARLLRKSARGARAEAAKSRIHIANQQVGQQNLACMRAFCIICALDNAFPSKDFSMTDHAGINRGRRTLVIASACAGGAATVAAAVPFAASMLPSDRAKAMGAPVEADISQLAPGE